MGVQVGGQGLGGQGLGRGQGLGVGVKVEVKVGVKVRAQGHGLKVRVMIGGHKVGSMLGVKVRGVVKVMVRGSMPGGLGSDGRWGGRLEMNILFLSRTVIE